MGFNIIRNILALCIAGFIVAFSLSIEHTDAQTAFLATSTVTINICGDATLQVGEICDDGVNTGDYSTSTVGRICSNDCLSYGPYCGDGILQPFFGEECDDGNNVSGDVCDALCQNEQAPTTVPSGGGSSSSSGGGGGGSSEGNAEKDDPTEVHVNGLAYPGATVSILLDGTVSEVVEADSDGDFEHEFRDLTPGVSTFGFLAEDTDGRESLTFTTTFEVIESAITTLSGIYIPPTIEADPIQVPQGQTVTFSGQSAPSIDLITHIDNSEFIATTSSADSGEWLIAFNTGLLTNESFHSAKALYRDPNSSRIESGFSQLVSFYVGVRELSDVISPDLNQDGSVNLVDFSILLFNWGSATLFADLNQDGTVNLPDFSIMLFNWTG